MVAGTITALRPKTVHQDPGRIGDRHPDDASEGEPAADLGHRQPQPDTAEYRDDVEQATGSHDRVDQPDEAYEDIADLRGEQPHLSDERRPPAPSAPALRAGQAAGLTDRDPGEQAHEKAGRAIREEGRGETQVVGEETTRKRTDADREDEDPVVDRHHAPAPDGGGDIRQHDLARGQDEAGPGPREETRSDEFGEVAGLRAPQVAERRDDPPDRERRPPPESIAELARRHGDHESRQTVDCDREADRRSGDAERLRVERERPARRRRSRAG